MSLATAVRSAAARGRLPALLFAGASSLLIAHQLFLRFLVGGDLFGAARPAGVAAAERAAFATGWWFYLALVVGLSTTLVAGPDAIAAAHRDRRAPTLTPAHRALVGGIVLAAVSSFPLGFLLGPEGPAGPAGQFVWWLYGAVWAAFAAMVVWTARRGHGSAFLEWTALAWAGGVGLVLVAPRRDLRPRRLRLPPGVDGGHHPRLRGRPVRQLPPDHRRRPRTGVECHPRRSPEPEDPHRAP